MRITSHEFRNVVSLANGLYEVLAYRNSYEFELSEGFPVTILPALDGGLIYAEWWPERQVWEIYY